MRNPVLIGKRIAWLLLAVSCFAILNGAAGQGLDKAQYHLFNPTPPALTREMSTDRPDVTESPYTVDAGHFQVEASFFDFSTDQTGGVRTEAWAWGALNLKAGITPDIDLQIVFDLYASETTRAAGVRDQLAGFGDVQTRLKVNVWGNDGGPTALALMPFVKIPTSTPLSNNHWEGGLIIPFALSLGDRVGAGLMAEVDFAYDPATGGYDTVWVHTATLGIEIVESLGMFFEFVGVASAAAGFDYAASVNTGVTYGIADNVVLDAGVRIGVNDAAEDFGVFAGISVRY